jgi:hypothetical protein
VGGSVSMARDQVVISLTDQLINNLLFNFFSFVCVCMWAPRRLRVRYGRTVYVTVPPGSMMHALASRLQSTHT